MSAQRMPSAQASHFLFTLAECCNSQHDPQCPAAIREAMRWAVDLVGSAPLGCILCGEPLNGTPSYLSLMLPHELGWVPHYAGVCVGCGTSHERAWLQRQVEARALFAFGEPVGTA